MVFSAFFNTDYRAEHVVHDKAELGWKVWSQDIGFILCTGTLFNFLPTVKKSQKKGKEKGELLQRMRLWARVNVNTAEEQLDDLHGNVSASNGAGLGAEQKLTGSSCGSHRCGGVFCSTACRHLAPSSQQAGTGCWSLQRRWSQPAAGGVGNQRGNVSLFFHLSLFLSLLRL